MQIQILPALRTLFMVMISTLALVLYSTSASAQYSSYFVANLDGAQQGTSSPGTAFGRVTIDDTNPMNIMVRISISYSGLQAGATTIHVYGPPIVSEPPPPRFVVQTSGGTSGFVRNQNFTIPEAEAADAQALRAGLFYFIVNTTLYPQGEIRGQILLNNPFVGTLNGAQHNNSSTGAGYTHISLNASETRMMVFLKYSFINNGQSASLYGAPGMFKDLGAPDLGGGPGANFGEYYDKLFEVTPQEVALMKTNGFFGYVSAANANHNILGRIQAPGRGRRRSDFDGDGSTDIAVFRHDDAIWYALQSSNSVVTYNYWGLRGDEIIAADYDGDGQTDRAVFRAAGVIDNEPVENVWLIEPSSTYDPGAPGNNLRIEFFGLAGDVRLPHDYDGDGQTDVAVWRPQNGDWYIMQSSTRTFREQHFGQEGDKPMPGDYDGDHKTDLAVFRAPTLYILRSSDGGVQYVTLEAGQPEPRDYDGDGTVDIAVIQSVNGEATWRIRQSSNGALVVVTHGLFSDSHVPADYDGDGKTDLAGWRSSDATWRILQSSNGQVRVVNFGLLYDVLIPGGL
ncbi:MAG TPA: FG-GAP-like repeat-containing protein [Pyrinomonadaceae bacterium]|nr:FG-GAP-like repeat-containing protein [Pyrinomonadaceae bacterium]